MYACINSIKYFIQVSDEGDVLYVFPRDYRSKLAAKSFRIQIEPFLEKAKVLSFVRFIDFRLAVN